MTKNELKNKVICLGEYSHIEDRFYVTTIKPFSSQKNDVFIVQSPEKFWKINFCTILNNTTYCVVLSQKTGEHHKNKNLILSKISFIKYTKEKIIGEESINEKLIYCAYNPKNTIELIVCGVGYLRLWNVFINEGNLKEHQQRFLKLNFSLKNLFY